MNLYVSHSTDVIVGPAEVFFVVHDGSNISCVSVFWMRFSNIERIVSLSHLELTKENLLLFGEVCMQ